VRISQKDGDIMGRRRILKSSARKSRIPKSYKGFRIVLVNENHPSLGRGTYRAMNFYAAEEKGLPFPYGKKTFVLWNEDSDPIGTIQHEVDEVYSYELGMSYDHFAHPIATAMEPVWNVRRKLKAFTED